MMSFLPSTEAEEPRDAWKCKDSLEACELWLAPHRNPAISLGLRCSERDGPVFEAALQHHPRLRLALHFTREPSLARLGDDVKVFDPGISVDEVVHLA